METHRIIIVFIFERKHELAGETELGNIRKEARNKYEDMRKKYEKFEYPGCYEDNPENSLTMLN